MSDSNYYYTLQEIENLELEKKQLIRSYKAAIKNDLPFEETKELYFRLKEIKEQLEIIEQKKYLENN